MWARKYKKCIRCKRTKIEHEAKGLCKSCYSFLNVNLRSYQANYIKAYKNRINFNGLKYEKLKISPTCEMCDCEKKLIVHHKDQNKRNNVLENFVTLCGSCHSGLHHFFRVRKKYGQFSNFIC